MPFVNTIECSDGYAGFATRFLNGSDLFLQPHLVVLSSDASASSGGCDSWFGQHIGGFMEQNLGGCPVYARVGDGDAVFEG